MTDFSKMLVRCSAISCIMSRPKGAITEKQLSRIKELEEREKIGKLTEKQLETLEELVEKRNLGEQLSATCKKYLIRNYAIEKYKRQPEITTKQMVKGIICEPDGVDIFNRTSGTSYLKNTKQLKNDWISGTPDLFDGPSVMESDEIVDIKCSWDILTFLNRIADPMSKSYYWQLQGYMALTGAKMGTLAFCLVNMHPTMIEQEKYRLFMNMNCVTEESPEFKLAAAKLEYDMTFDDIPENERVLRFYVERNDEDIAKIYQKVYKCREFLVEFEDQHEYFTKSRRREARKLISLDQNDSE
jgi:hypothetical protein